MEGLTASRGNSLRMRIFYGRAYPMADSSARLETQDSDLSEYRSADNHNQFASNPNSGRTIHTRN